MVYIIEVVYQLRDINIIVTRYFNHLFFSQLNFFEQFLPQRWSNRTFLFAMGIFLLCIT